MHLVVLQTCVFETRSQRISHGSFLCLQAYLSHFSECLRQEYADQGITIQLLKPYFIADGTVENIIPAGNIFAPTPAKYARAAVATLGWSDSSTGYWLHTVQVRPICDRSVPFRIQQQRLQQHLCLPDQIDVHCVKILFFCFSFSLGSDLSYRNVEGKLSTGG